ncbi:MAG: sugar ABC transporter substrate-binding protein, partial [Vicinamibacteria bacterium]
MWRRLPISWRVTFLGLVATLALAAAACGGNGESEGVGGREQPARTGTPAESPDIEAELQALVEGESYEEPPSSSPKPQAGKKIWVLSCFEASETCSVPAAATVEAAKILGWETTLYDTRSEPARIAESVRQAIAGGADGITLYGLDCEQIGPQPLRELREAGVKVSAAESQDCETPLFDAVVSYANGPYPEWFRAFGAAQATALIAATDGKANVILFDGPIEALSLGFPRDGFKERLASCAGCEIVETVEFTIPDLGP